jgi:hypothetical protein
VRAGRTLDLSPPTEEISQDRLWEVVESTPPPSPPPAPPEAAPGGFGELTLEDLGSLPLPEAPRRPQEFHLELEPVGQAPGAPPAEAPSEELPPLELEPVEGKASAPTPPAEMGTLLESLSLEELLSAPPPAPSPTAEGEPLPLEEPSGGPVFDLTSEMESPSLPLVEVGTGEPPALSIEDLLTSTAPAPPAPPPAGEVGLPELELELTPGAAAEGAAVEEMPAAPTPLDLGALVEVPLSEPGTITLEAAPEAAEMPAPPGEVPPPLPSLEVEAVAAEVPPAVAPPPMVEEISAPLLEPPETPVTPPEAGKPGGPEAHPTDLAMLREAVAERVAHDLTRELSEKLLARIEQIVWEVVPDMAEILITKEIERIRALAEGKPSS